MNSPFSNLTSSLSSVIKKITGQGRLTEANIEEALRSVRTALLEADVALPVAKTFIEDIKPKALGTEVMGSLTPGDVLIKIVHDELVHIMGDYNEALNLKAAPPAIILMAGLQGSGKTTTVAKLARHLIEQKKSVMVTSADVYRPAAIDQLETLAKTVGAQFFPSNTNQAPVDIAKGAIQAAKNKVVDVLIVDTAGRLHIDDAMMAEIKALHAAIDPIETLFVVDSMTGQDAATTAKAFNDALPLTGVVLTKTDGDARGGAALSIRHITGKPIKFMGIGEKTDALEPFYPDRLASRILDMGDIVSLVEDVQKNLDTEKAAKFVKKLKKDKTFDFNDFLDQLEQINKMGGMMGIMSKLPGMNQLPANLKDKMNDDKIKEVKAIINSMTPKERRFPENIRHSQKVRIAKGSGKDVQKVNALLRQFDQMRKMMKKMMQGGGFMKNLMRMAGGGKFPFGGGMGGMPPGGMPF